MKVFCCSILLLSFLCQTTVAKTSSSKDTPRKGKKKCEKKKSKGGNKHKSGGKADGKNCADSSSTSSSSSSEDEKTFSNPPNVVIFMVDDLGYNQVGYHANPAGNGEISTPSIDQHAKDGIHMDRGYMTPWCGPSRAAFQSGSTTSFNDNITNVMWSVDDDIGFPGGMPPGTNTLATAFQSYGESIGAPYSTSYHGKWGIGGSAWANTPLGMGYDEFDGFWGDSIDPCDGYYTILATQLFFKTSVLEEFGGVFMSALPGFWRQSADIESELCGYFSSLDGLSDAEKEVACQSEPVASIDKLFDLHILDKTVQKIMDHYYNISPLLHVHSMQLMHTPMYYPKKYDEESHLEDLPEYFRDGATKPTATNEDLRLSTANALRFLDDVFDGVVQSLKDAGQWENTIVLFTSDNGGAMNLGSANNNYPLRGAKFTPFEGGLRVPQFLSGGWINKNLPSTRSSLSQTFMFPLDWAPTLLEMVGGDVSHLLNDKSGSRYGSAMWKHIAASVTPEESISNLHQKERLVSYSPNIMFNVTNDRTTKFLHFGNEAVLAPRHWSPVFPTNDDQSFDLSNWAVKPCRFDGAATDCCYFDISNDPHENIPIRTDCAARRSESSAAFHDTFVCAETPQICLEPGPVAADEVLPDELTIWTHYGAIGPFLTTDGRVVGEDLEMKCVCRRAASDLEVADIDFFAVGILSTSQCFSSKTTSRRGAIPCNGELVFEPERDDRFTAYTAVGIDAMALDELTQFELDRQPTIGPTRSLITAIFSYALREGFSEWPGVAKWPFVALGEDSCAEKNATTVPASLNSMSPWFLATDIPTIAGRSFPQLGLCVLFAGTQEFCPAKQNANLTKVDWTFEGDSVYGTFVDGRRWIPMTIPQCIATCQITPERTAYIGDGPNGITN